MKRMIKRATQWTLALMMSGSVAQAMVAYKFQPSQGKIEFKTKGWPSLITIKGEGEGVQGQLINKDGKLNGQLQFQLSTLKTGIDLRDTHMKDKYLEVKSFPTATLTLSDVVVPKNLQGDIQFKGAMKLHGKTKNVEITGTLKNSSGKISMTATIPIKLTDFSIPIPNYKGITVAETVNISFASTVANN